MENPEDVCPVASVRSEFVEDCRVMLRYARESELSCDVKSAASIVMRIDGDIDSPPSHTEIIETHQSLMRTVEPATSATLRHYFFGVSGLVEA